MATADYPFFSTSEAAIELGMTDGRVRQMIRAKEIKAHKVGDRGYAIPADEVARIKKQEQTRGRPRKSSS